MREKVNLLFFVFPLKDWMFVLVFLSSFLQLSFKRCHLRELCALTLIILFPHTFFYNHPGGVVVVGLPLVREVLDSIPGQVIQKTLKIVVFAWLPSLNWSIKHSVLNEAPIACSMHTEKISQILTLSHIQQICSRQLWKSLLKNMENLYEILVEIRAISPFAAMF